MLHWAILLVYFTAVVRCCFPVIPDGDMPGMPGMPGMPVMMIPCPPLDAYIPGGNSAEAWFSTIGPAIMSTTGASCPAGQALFATDFDNDFLIVYGTTCDTTTGTWTIDLGDTNTVDNPIFEFACGATRCPLPTPCAGSVDPIIRVQGNANAGFNRMLIRCSGPMPVTVYDPGMRTIGSLTCQPPNPPYAWNPAVGSPFMACC